MASVVEIIDGTLVVTGSLSAPALSAPNGGPEIAVTSDLRLAPGRKLLAPAGKPLDLAGTEHYAATLEYKGAAGGLPAAVLSFPAPAEGKAAHVALSGIARSGAAAVAWSADFGVSSATSAVSVVPVRNSAGFSDGAKPLGQFSFAAAGPVLQVLYAGADAAFIAARAAVLTV